MDGAPNLFLKGKELKSGGMIFRVAGGGFEDGFNHQSVAPGWCKLGQGPRGLISGGSKINGFRGFDLDGKTWENLSLSSKGQCFSATVDVGQNGSPRGPQMEMSSLVLTIQLLGYLILTHTQLLMLPPSDGNSRTLATVTVCTSS